MDIHLVKAFTSNPQQGNPAGVIFDADDLSQEEMIGIAAQLGFSESVFVVSPSSDDADYRFRFMTSLIEVDACGHATLAGSHALFERKPFDNIKIETGAGLVSVQRGKDGLLMIKMAKAELGVETYDKDEISKLLGLNSDLLEDLPIRTASVASPKLMIPIKSLKEVESITPDFDAMIAFCAQYPVKGFYAFTKEVIDPSSDFHARQFNPAAGIPEDPITGIAGGALALYAKECSLVEDNLIRIEQGYELNKPGQIIVELKEGNVYVGGYAVSFGTKAI